MRGSGNNHMRLMAGFYSDGGKLAAFARFVPDKNLDGPLRLVCGG